MPAAYQKNSFPYLNNEHDVFKGTLSEGYFSEKIIPIFSGKDFYDFIISSNSTVFKTHNKSATFGYVQQRGISNKAKTRTYAIPHPKPYYHLCECIYKNWKRIYAIVGKRWKIKSCNLGCARKIKNSFKIFEMNYASRTHFAAEEYTKISFGKNFLVEADISNFFPSIYTHSIPWSIVGRDKAYKSKRKKVWYNNLDSAIRNSQNGESNGIHIGPHTSNIISDIVLTKIDETLCREGYEFIRYIDDYKCYTRTRDDAERFITTLSDLLSEFRLTLNANKTKFHELPTTMNNSWPNKLKSFPFRKRTSKHKILLDDTSINEISDFFDFAIETEKNENNAAVLNYAIKIISKAQATPKALSFIQQKCSHLVYLFPYLSSLLPLIMKNSSQQTFQHCFHTIFERSLVKKEWASSSFAVYTALTSNYKTYHIRMNIDDILESKDCILILATFLYFQKFNIDTTPIISFANNITSNMRDDEYWPLIYELFRQGMITNVKARQEFIELKRHNISFIKV